MGVDLWAVEEGNPLLYSDFQNQTSVLSYVYGWLPGGMYIKLSILLTLYAWDKYEENKLRTITEGCVL